MVDKSARATHDGGIIRHGSLFSGIGGFDLGFDRAGIETAWQVEVDAKCNEVLSHHWPNVKKHGGINDVGKHNLESVDIITGGFPCQDLSVAGKRKGLAGSRSGLWFQFHRVLAELKPRWCVIENVPGLLSSNNGKDMEMILDSLEDLRYVIDCDIIDAQYFGVAQRRRRVFIVCQQVDDILKQKTTSSAQTIAQCLIEILGSILIEARTQSLIGYESSTSESKYCVDGLKRRMKLFGIADKERWPMLQASLGAERARFLQERASSDWSLGESEGDTNQTIKGDLCEDMLGETAIASGLWNTAPRWQTILEDLSQVMKLYTTSTELKQIAESQIYTFAQAVLTIVEFIILSNSSCPTYWSAATSTLTVIEEYISYARQAGSSLFTKLEWVQPWRDFVWQAERTRDALINTGTRSGQEILFEPESLSWDSTPSRETGARIAASLTRGSASGSGVNEPGRRREDDVNLVARPLAFGSTINHYDESQQTYIPQVSPTLTGAIADSNRKGWAPVNEADALIPVAKTLGSHHGRNDLDSMGAYIVFEPGNLARRCGANPTTEIVPTLGAEKLGGTFPHVAYTIQTNDGGSHKRKDRPQGGMYVKEADASLTLGSSGQTVVAFANVSDGSSARNAVNLAPPLTNRHGDPNSIAGQFGVRRLTPIECERLQGFPDGWTAVNGMSDSARYRMLRNAVAVPVAGWIGQRLAKQV